MPGMQYCPVEVQTSPRRTMKKWVELQVATKPSGSSIRASSAPALVGLDAGGDAVELGMRVEFLVLHIGCAAPHVHGVQRHAAFRIFRGSAPCIRE